MKTIEITGTIIPNEDQMFYDWFGVDATSPRKVKNALAEAGGEEVTVEINSGGGDLWAGNEISHALATYAGKVTADITGIAASAATVVACGADHVRMSPGAQYMIHNVSSYAFGDHNEMDKTSGILQNADKATSNVYRMKTGMSTKKLLELMNAETWMDADKAIKYGFVDEIIGGAEQDNKNPDSFTLINAVPHCVILSEEQKAEAKAALQAGENGKDERIRLMQNQLTLLKLKGGISHV